MQADDFHPASSVCECVPSTKIMFTLTWHAIMFVLLSHTAGGAVGQQRRKQAKHFRSYSTEF